MNLKENLSQIRVLMLDLDGVLTDGRIYYGNHGDEIKCFDMQDGLGIVSLKKLGVPTIVVSGRKSKVNERRMKEINVQKLYQNISNKLAVFEKTLKKCRLKPEHICYVGDDIIDLPVMKKAGVAVAVPNAVRMVKEVAHYVTEARGGEGAVREVIDMIIEAKGQWNELLNH